jgi:hypothetical protein
LRHLVAIPSIQAGLNQRKENFGRVKESEALHFPAKEAGHALAFVRDEEVWSVLKAAGPDATESFGLFSFHFRDGLANSGFVGWLASTLKRELGTGVFVVCGQNSRCGGIFDYWAVPVAMHSSVVRLLNQLRQVPPHACSDGLAKLT